MQQKTIEILLKLNDQMNAQLSKNTATVKEASAAIDGLTAKVHKNDIAQANAARTTKKSSSMFAGMGKSLAGVAAAYLSFTAVVSTAQRSLGFVVQTGMDYEQSLANTRAILQPTTRDMMALAQASKDLGATTKYTAAQASDAQTEFGKLGFTTGQILGAQEAALNLAAAANLELARAAEITGVTLQQFSMNASESSKVTDIMAKAANMAALDVEQFGESMKYTGTIASQSGYSIEETSAAIAVLSDEAVVGSQAGTSLRRIISTLANESSLASKEIKRLNPNATTLADKFDVLSKMGLDSSSAMKLFRIEASTAAIILANGSEKLRDYTEQLKNVEGYAKRVALIQMDTLSGDLLVAKSAAENLAISLSQAFGAEQRGAVQAFTKLIGEVNTWVEENPDKLRAWSDAVKDAFETAKKAAGGLLWILKQTSYYQTLSVGSKGAGLLSNLIGGNKEGEDSITAYQRQTETVMRIVKDSQAQLDKAYKDSARIRGLGGNDAIVQMEIDRILTEIDKNKELLHIKYDVIKAEYDQLKASKSLDVEQEKRLNQISREIDAYGIVRSENMASVQAQAELAKRTKKLLEETASPVSPKNKGKSGLGIDVEDLKNQEDLAKKAIEQYKNILRDRKLAGLQSDELVLAKRIQFWDKALEIDRDGGGRYIREISRMKAEELALLRSGIGYSQRESDFEGIGFQGFGTYLGGGDYTPQTGGDSASSASAKAQQQAIDDYTKLKDEAFALNQQYNLSEIELERLKYADKIALMEQFRHSTVAIAEEQAKAIDAIERKKTDQVLESAARMNEGLLAAAESFHVKNKAIRVALKASLIAEATANAIVAGTRVYKDLPIYAAIPAYIGLSAGLAAQVNEIRGLKFSQGGMVPSVPGLPYTGDHVPILANPGERVLTKEQNRDYERGVGGSRVINLNYAPVYATDTSEAQKRRDYRMFKREVRTVVDDPEFSVSQGVFA